MTSGPRATALNRGEAAGVTAAASPRPDEVVLEVSGRPWGRFTTLDQGPGHKVKRLEVLPGKRLSYQTHAFRCEHWVIVAGTGVVTLDGRELPVTSGDQLVVSIGTPHRIANVGPDPLVFIEVQRGTYLGEDDIVRLSDDFGRA